MIHPKTAQTSVAVADHYDELDPVYRDIWGEHVHHGYWLNGRETPEQAVEALADLVGDRLSLSPGQQVCDIGCGYGATARRFAMKRQVAVTGLTISPIQAERALLGPTNDGLTFLRRDWLSNGLADASFDRAYAIESSEHMVDKQRFFDEAFRVLRPGGCLVVCAWLGRAEANALEIKHLLEPICREGRLPSLGTEEDYLAMAAETGFRVTSVEDISGKVRRTWTVCIRRLLHRLITDNRYRRMVMSRRTRNRDFALSPFRIALAYRTRSMRYALMVFDKD